MVNQLVQIVEARIHMAAPLPDVADLARLRDFDPDMYQQWRADVAAQAEHERAMESEQVTRPGKLAGRGQVFAMIFCVLVIGLAATALVLDHPWAASVIAALGVASVVSAFLSSGRRRDDG